MNATQSLGKRVRHLQRYRQIAQIFIRNGFGWFIDGIGFAEFITLPKRFFTDAQRRESLSTVERIRLVIEQLGPTFIKLGQIASLRTDVFPPEFIQELTKLQDEVPPVPFPQIREIVEMELGGPLQDTFRTFDETPIGSASIGQVHRAVLWTGEVVAVKVQRPDIERQIRVDLEVLADLAQMAERRFDWARLYQVSDVVAEFTRSLRDELDYTLEGRNADRIRKIFEDDPTVYIPEIYWDLTTPRVLVMEFVEGIKLKDVQALEQAGFDRQRLAANAARAVFTQLLIHGFFHADPHPGNLAALPNHVILFMDFGMVGRLTPDMKDRLASLVVGLMRKNTELIMRGLYRMGVVPLDVDDHKLRRDVEMLREKYYDIPLSQISLASSVNDIFQVAYRHRIQIPPDLALVGKTLLTIEGVVEELDPNFRIMDVAEPFGRQLLKERLHPRTIGRNLVSTAMDVTEFLVDFPKQVRFMVQEIGRGKIKVQMEVNEVNTILSKLDRISNRLSFSVMLLALSIFMAGLLIASALAKSANLLWRFPLTEVGLILGGVMLVWLIWAIFRSGRM
ncbi:AarF/ABC1/UbiB kinase family protein [Alicyclobacillus cycloheptanicus]|uniref:Ubiquinone biosynthesis protein n=1 Tax=Alicyclobacillus cycloheptanicus TaxID=1457 RepID=A0ABT9XKG7_9BACL|nr:AarF/ABC1/UbiB kinase family protein [Alicyclobacillus cycloheptanicus]MDQ0190795.1 ubiquinone biosynthesis protein [Alicyclobacillus cycloheptanicus]WDM02723.1 AarF/ABC1/UbiB kinase family protein [Alicyclobacillus cycloheptanicus]